MEIKFLNRYNTRYIIHSNWVQCKT